MGPTILTLTNISKKYDLLTILTNVNYEFEVGFLYIIIGVSGSGKTTLLHIIAGIIKQTTGYVQLQNHMIKKKDQTIVLQHPYLFGDLTIRENILVPHLFDSTNRKTMVKHYAKLLQITNILNRRASVCSGGEKARANLVRGIVSANRLMLVDEPTANVDLENAKLIVNALGVIALTKIVIVTTHQPELFKENNVKQLKISGGNLYEI